MLAFIVAMHVVGSVPADASIATWSAAQRHGVDPFELGAYLISEHGDDWTPDTDRCSHRGACGPFQLMPLWPGHFGYPLEARSDLDASADIAAQIIVYTKDRHADCWPHHEWQAHLKCSRASRSSCVRPVENWKRFECRLRQRAGAGECPDDFVVRAQDVRAYCPTYHAHCELA